MGLIMNMVFADIAIILATVAIGVIMYFQWAFTYWKKKGVPYIQPNFPFGNIENPFTRQAHISFRIKTFYDTLKSQGHRHGGMYIFAKPTYIVVDPEYVRNIMSKDFSYFTDRGVYYNEKDDPLSAHLFSIEGQKWRNLRTKLTPTFTSGKMKMMFQTLITCSDQLIEAMNEFHKENKAIDIKDVLGCFTTDIIGSCAFGLNCNSFKDPNGDFRKYGKKIFEAMSKFKAAKTAVAFANPNLGRRLGITMSSPEVTKFFMKVVKDTVEYREKTNYLRKDFMQILIDLKNNKMEEEANETNNYTGGLSIEEVAAQAFVFFLAGFETSSTTMSFCLFELALNQDIQQRVREEVNRVFEKYQGKMSYDAIMEFKYMNQVVDETLRKYPPVAIIPRRCVRDYRIPESDVVIDKGTTVMIPALALQHDPELFPNPEKFDPERFSEENKSNIVPYTYVPFGEGPRICIGARFGLMQTKVGLAALLNNYRFTLNEKTDVPLVMDPFSFILTAKGGIWLNIEKIGA